MDAGIRTPSSSTTLAMGNSSLLRTGIGEAVSSPYCSKSAVLLAAEQTCPIVLANSPGPEKMSLPHDREPLGSKVAIAVTFWDPATGRQQQFTQFIITEYANCH